MTGDIFNQKSLIYFYFLVGVRSSKNVPTKIGLENRGPVKVLNDMYKVDPK